MKKIIICTFLIFAFVSAQIAYAADDSGFGLDKTAAEAGYETTGPDASLPARIQTIVSFALGFVALLFFGLTLYGGFYWLTARGKEDRVATAKEILEAAIIGLAIVGTSYAIAYFVLSRIGGMTAAEPTSQVYPSESASVLLG